MKLRTILRRVTPDWARRGRRERRWQTLMRHHAPYAGLPPADLFARVYESRDWPTPDGVAAPFYSGPGSHEEAVIGPYVASVRRFLESFETPPSALDIGCGDFNVGSRIRPLCGRYTACDVVGDLIAHNKERFAELDVDFRALDITAETPERHDVCFIRQVLQHLSNADIARALPHLRACCRHLVVTEHVPEVRFKANRDMPSGPGIRLGIDSGVVLTEHPFSLEVKGEHFLCEVPQIGGVIRTVVYELAA